MDAVRLASLGARRTRAGANQPAATDAPSGPRPPTSDYNHDDDDDDDAAPPLPPVSRRDQASVIVAAFLAIALTIGYNQSYGVFQEYYLSPGQDVLVHRMKTNTALLAFVGTLGAGLTWAGSLVVNPWLARAEHAAAVWQARADAAAAAAAAAATIASLSARRPRTRLSPALLATPAFLFAVAAAFFQAAGGTLPLTFVPSYSVSLGLSAGTGATLLAVANAVNAVARVAAGYAGDRLGRLNVLVVSLAVAAAAVAALWGLSVAAAAANNVDNTHSTHLWLAFVVLYSIAAGGYYALFPATIADVFGIRRYAAVNGFLYFVRGCGTMLGSPVGGVLLGKDNKNGGGSRSSGSHAYADVVVWDGALLAGAAAGGWKFDDGQ
ncbi:Major facilitator superfamily domain, general substrate transporter [Niveomyces insectorum RCEF 264]|uniref:Major facilitator superfamily domain, general substrate transporter n=1 Tax=Niveomyces insectorum RCEF 264 TaxID=1081102 RepID=A0A167XW46_9HYPO|nr:Major facilitator superfamily domain, general substrate transporter [Niveomyces insectorum RCEF 264]